MEISEIWLDFLIVFATVGISLTLVVLAIFVSQLAKEWWRER